MIPTEVMLYMLYMSCYIYVFHVSGHQAGDSPPFSFVLRLLSMSAHIFPIRASRYHLHQLSRFLCVVFHRCQHTCFQIVPAGIVCISREDFLCFVFHRCQHTCVQIVRAGFVRSSCVPFLCFVFCRCQHSCLEC